MHTDRRPAAAVTRKLMVVAAVVAVTMLGNLRLQASELGSPATRKTSSNTGVRVDSTGSKVATVASRDALATMIDADDARSVADDDARLVPAIYAWDPDVRFVYFRHVSKWM